MMNDLSNTLLELAIGIGEDFSLLHALASGVLFEAVIRAFKWHVKICRTLTFYSLLAIPLHLPQVTAASVRFGFYLPDPCQELPLTRGTNIAMLGSPVMALQEEGALITMFE
jgi:hypothetical protein